MPAATEPAVAKVNTLPVVRSIFRTLVPLPSVTYKKPSFTSAEVGKAKRAVVAGPSTAPDVLMAPANRLTRRVESATFRMVLLKASVTKRLPAPSQAGPETG